MHYVPLDGPISSLGSLRKDRSIPRDVYILFLVIFPMLLRLFLCSLPNVFEQSRLLVSLLFFEKISAYDGLQRELHDRYQ